jgi:drug/metabolite transporter (DMT)-like permease
VFSAERLRDWILLILCNFMWASQFVLVKIVQEQMGPIAATTIPMLLATLMLYPIVRMQARSAARKMPRRSMWSDWVAFALLGIVGQVTSQLFATWGMRYSLASNAALLNLAMPIATVVMAYFLLGEKMTVLRWVSFALAVAGVMECSGIDWKELNFANKSYLIGNILIFASVLGSAFYNTYSKKVLERYTPLEVLLYSYYFVMVFLIPITFYAEPNAVHEIAHYTARTWTGIALLAVFQYWLSMVIFMIVLNRLDATQAGLSNYMIPFFGLVIAAVVLHERLTLPMILGGILVLFSTLLITVYEEHKSRKKRLAAVLTR